MATRKLNKCSGAFCPICSSKFAELVFKKEDTSGQGELEVVRCKSCGFIYLKKSSSVFVDDLYKYYEQKIGMHRNDLFDQITETRYAEIVENFNDLISKSSLPKTILDVGCGYGHFVDFTSRYGWKSLGIDLSEQAVALGKSVGAPVEKKDLFSIDSSTESWSVVILTEVIEHVSNPVDFLSQVAALTKKSGIIYITTPNFNSLDRRLLGSDWDVIHKEHTVYFTPKSIYNLIYKIKNIEIDDIKTINFSPVAIFNSIFTKSHTNETCNTNVLRKTIESKRYLIYLKKLLNIILNWLNLGSSMVVVIRKK